MRGTISRGLLMWKLEMYMTFENRLYNAMTKSRYGVFEVWSKCSLRVMTPGFDDLISANVEPPMSRSIPTGYIASGSPGENFLSERIQATRQFFCLIPCPEAKMTVEFFQTRRTAP